MILPKKLEDGTPYISHSQYKAWNEKKSFNLKVEGKLEYIIGYFFKYVFEDTQGWAEFGDAVEEYVCEKTNPERFTKKEKEVLDNIEPLGKFQVEGILNFINFAVLLYIDDAKEDFTHIRDYKTASDNSRKKYYKEEYEQLDIYALWVQQQYKELPQTLEVVIVERKGNPFKGEKLTVGEEIWYHGRETSAERLEDISQKLVKTAEEISFYYKVFLYLCQ